MSRPWLNIVVGISIVVLMAVLSHSCKPTNQAPDARPTETDRPEPAQTAVAPAPVPSTAPAVPPVPADPNVLALIGEYVLRGDDFKREFLRELQPNPYAASPRTSVPEPKAVLMRMVGDKAIVVDARAKGMPQRSEIRSTLKRLREQRLASKAAVAAVEPKISVTEKDINDLMVKDPKLTRDRARSIAYNQKGNAIFAQYYPQLVQKLHLTKVTENLSKAAAIHKRLLSKPKPESKKNIYWIENAQIQTDLDPNEKALVLARYDGGQFTLEEWFESLCEMAPPGRPKDLDTAEGVERFLDRALQRPLLTAEAIAQGMDKDEKLIQDLRTREDDMVFGYAQQEWLKGLPEPNDQDLAAAYEKAKGSTQRGDTLKVDMIWCENRDTAAKARAELDQGKDFGTVQQRYALDKTAVQTVDLVAGTEGSFWPPLWQADPNQVVGPVLGLREGGLRWRVVRIKEKRPAKPVEFENAKSMLSEGILEQRNRARLDRVRADLLANIPHQVFADRLPAFDPMKVP